MTPFPLDPAHQLTSAAALDALYGTPNANSIAKEVAYLHPHYRKFVEAAPFFSLATVGPDGLDCSPRGDAPGFVRVHDEYTLLIPDRRGNNRVDSLKNLMADSRIALLFLIPGIAETLRINGRARLTVDPALLASFAVDDKPPRSVIVVDIETVYFQCSRALVRSHLWDAAAQISRSALPSTGTLIADIGQAVHKGAFDGAGYDREQDERVASSLY
jgi:uncharacterized protein